MIKILLTKVKKYQKGYFKAGKKEKTSIQTVSSAVQTTLVTDPKTGNLIPDYFGMANWAYSPPLRKFIDSLPGLGEGNRNTLEQYMLHCSKSSKQ